MAAGATNGHTTRKSAIPYIDLSYDGSDSDSSVRSLVYWIRPKWRETPEELEITKFTEGITNTLLRVRRKGPNDSETDVDTNSVLMRAYGNNTDLLIDRDREARSHGLLADRDMAPPLLARFRNGLLYGYIPGTACTAEDLTEEGVWRGVAQRLGEWHARVPISAVSAAIPRTKGTNGTNGTKGTHRINGHDTTSITKNGTNDAHKTAQHVSKCSPVPNIWTVMQKWIDALPIGTDKERARKQLLQHETDRTFEELDNEDGIGEHGFVFCHCDLLCANVIQLPDSSPEATRDNTTRRVTFIDYEYATPGPAAFDIANHFAEWIGYDCDYNRIPGRSTRKAFLREYAAAYSQFADLPFAPSIAEALFEEIDRFRGVPGLYWGIWALIQARISQIDFDYSTYAEERLGEYFAWRAESDGSRIKDGKKMPLREERWAGT